MKKKIVFSLCLSPNVHLLTKLFINWKYIYIQQRSSQRHFRHFKMISYLLPKKITLKSNHFIFPRKNKDICDYDPRCIMSSGLMFDDIIMDNIKRIVSSHNHTAEHDCVFTQIVSDIIYIYRRSLQYFYWKKLTCECIEIPREHFF